jgi:uridine monophosphate synthetase
VFEKVWSHYYDILSSINTVIIDQVGKLCTAWNASNGTCLGLVAGATDISSLQAVRAVAPTAWLLCPGVGAQGGSAEAVCGAGLRADGGGVLVAVSRGISDPACHLGGRGMADIARELRDQINVCRESKRREEHVPFLPVAVIASAEDGGDAISLRAYQREFIELSMHSRVLRFGSFTLKSGRVSPYFFNAGLFCGGKSMGTLCRCTHASEFMSCVCLKICLL